MSVRWGIISTARINDLVLEATAGSAGVRFEAVAGRDAERARVWAGARGIERSYGSYRELLADPAIDAVYVSLPNALHLEWTLAALEAGKHVLCEKPVGRDADRVAAAAALAEERGLVFAEAFMYRYHPQTERVRALIADGEIGRLRHVRATLCGQQARREGDPRLDVGLEGGALMDLGCYCASAIRHFGGEPEAVSAHYPEDGGEVDWRVLATLQCPAGVTAQLDAALFLPRHDRLELIGEEGLIVLDDPWHCRSADFELRRPSSPAYGPPPPGSGSRRIASDPRRAGEGDLLDAYRHELEAVSAAIDAGGEPEWAAADAVAQARLLAAIDESARSGERVAVPALSGSGR